MNLRKVVITGLGVIAPGGIGKDAFWDSMINARTQTGLITAFDTSGFLSKVAAEVKGFNPAAFGISYEEASGMDRYLQFALAGAKLAVEDAGLEFGGLDGEKCGVALANAICGTKWMEEEFLRVTGNGHGPIDPSPRVAVSVRCVHIQFSRQLHSRALRLERRGVRHIHRLHGRDGLGCLCV